MKTKIWFQLAGVEDFVIVPGQIKANEARYEIPDGAEYIDHESQPCCADAQFDL